jgi:hypothetical protein
MTTITAKIIADSRAPSGSRLTTLLLRYPRWIHAEGRTHRLLAWDEPEFLPERGPLPRSEVREVLSDLRHRMTEAAIEIMLRDGKTEALMDDPSLSRNAASSRAIPVPRMVKDVQADTAVPLFWGSNQKGMQAGEECNNPVVIRFPMHDEETGALLHTVELTKTREEVWIMARDFMIHLAEAFHAAGYHKQIVNRLLEPFSHINVLVTGTEWDNFFKLRVHADAEPHIKLLAERIREAMEASTPVELRPGDWHVPFVNGGMMPRELDATTKETNLVLAVACAASTSYTTVDGLPMTTDAASRIYAKLTTDPLHASPFEHQAVVAKMGGLTSRFHRNFASGWAQHRALVEMGCLGEFL